MSFNSFLASNNFFLISGVTFLFWTLSNLSNVFNGVTRGTKKNTPYAAQMAAEDAVTVAKDAGLRKVKVYVKGPGNGRESAIRSIHNGGIEVTEIVDVTPTPHNGCRPPKRRRV